MTEGNQIHAFEWRHIGGGMTHLANTQIVTKSARTSAKATESGQCGADRLRRCNPVR